MFFLFLLCFRSCPSRVFLITFDLLCALSSRTSRGFHPSTFDGEMQLFALLSFLGGASALIASPLAAHATQQRVAVSPMMACNGGKGGRGGEGPPLDKMRRGRVKALIQAVRGLPLAPHRT